MKQIKVLRIILDVIEIYVPSILFIIFFILFIVQVFLRYFLNRPPMWANEICMYSFVWVVFLGACLADRTKDHLVFSVVYDMVPSKVKKIFDVLSQLIIVGIFIAILPATYNFFEFCKTRNTPLLQFPLFFGYMGFLFFLVITIGRSIVRLVYLFRKKVSNDASE